MATKAEKTRPFEKSLADLEKTVSALEKGDSPLEDQLKAFEKGIAYSRECLERLEAVEKRVEQVLGDGAGNLTTQPLDPS